MSNTAQITIDSRFFEVAAAQSSRYPRLWTIAKETVQNTQDARATEIRFRVDGNWVTIADNGPGMGPTGGIANFLTIGASQKNMNGSTTGFFSTAKMRICFIHQDWKIQTGSEYLEKSMLGNEAIRQVEHFAGCQIQIRTKDDTWNALEISDYIGLCNPQVAVYINDQRVRRTYRRGTLKANFEWADVYVNRGDKAQKGTLVVRVNGLAMFTRLLPNVRAQVTVELDSELSRRVLQENREALVWSAEHNNGQCFYPQNELDTLVRGLITNPSAVKPKSKTVIEFVSGLERVVPTLTSRFNGESHPLSARVQTIKFTNAPVGSSVSIPIGSIDVELDGEVTIATEEVVETLKSHTITAKFNEIFPYDYIVKREGKKLTPHTKHARVLKAWKQATEVIAEVGGISSKFGVGLCVDQESKAEFAETQYGDFLLIDYRSFRLSGSQLTETMKMVRLACHELTHALGYHDHNEAFIIAEGALYEDALGQLTRLRKATKGLTTHSRGYGKV